MKTVHAEGRYLEKENANTIELIEILFRLNSVYSSGKEEYQLDSATKAPFFFDINSVASFPYFRDVFVETLTALFNKLIHAASGIPVIAAAGHSGIPFAALVSEKLKLPMVYVRESSKKHGKKNMIEGSLKSGSECIIFTECLSSFSKVENIIVALEECGAEVKGIATFINMESKSYYETGSSGSSLIRSADSGSAGIAGSNPGSSLAGKRIPVGSAATLEDIAEYAASSPSISSKVSDMFHNWNKAASSAHPAPDNGISGLTDSENKAAEVLLEIKAVALSVSAPFRYASGILSPVYCDNRLMISSPEKWDIIIKILEDIIRSKIGLENIEVIAGTSTAGIPHASRLASKLALPLIYVKSENGINGKKSCIEGTLFYGKRVLVVEDLVSTGKSSIEAVRILRQHGAAVENCAAIFTYQMKSAEKIFNDENCSLYCASNFSAMIKTAVTNKYISNNDAEIAVSWNMDPENWGKTHGYE